MESQENTDASHRTLHALSARLSLFCPGLGQLVQGRFCTFLGHFTLLSLAIVGICSFFAFVQESFNRDVALSFFLFLIPLGLPVLLFVLLIVFSVQDAATYTPGKPSPFQNRLTVLTVLLVVSSCFSLLLPAVVAARGACRHTQCNNRLTVLSLAFYNYHETYGSLPPAYTVDENGKPLHSWRVLVLPFLEENELYEKIRLDEPWNSEYNRQFHDVDLQVYQCPSNDGIVLMTLKNRNTFRAGNCNYSVIVGDETLFPGSRPVCFKDVTNDLWNSILVVERLIPVCWMDPNNEIRFETACEGINRNLLGIGSEHPGCATFAFADVSVRTMSEGHISTYEGKPYKSLKPLLMKSGEQHLSE